MMSAFRSLKDRFGGWTGVAMIVVMTSLFAAAQAPLKSFVLHDAPKPVATVAFDDAEGHSRTLADFKGKVVLLNIWATWCVPCRKEMPALDRLQGAMGSPDFEVLPVSIDRGGIAKVRDFYSEIGVRHLAMYIDVSGQAPRALGAVGLPTTLVISDPQNGTPRRLLTSSDPSSPSRPPPARASRKRKLRLRRKIAHLVRCCARSNGCKGCSSNDYPRRHT